MMRVRILAALALLMSVRASAASPDDDKYGPPPDWARFKELGEAAVRAKLPDADKWAIEWPNGYMKGGWRHRGKFYGYLSCGVIRAIAPVTERYPLTNFAIVINFDQVQTVDISDRARNSLVNVFCNVLVSRGTMPPARFMEGPKDIAVATLGITIRPMPEGAYIVAVTPGSRSGAVNLEPGIVITRANGIALAGLGPAMAQVLGADTPRVAIETAAGVKIEIDDRDAGRGSASRPPGGGA